MYQRRAKRVAGPGFHVNVKMDQFQIATMRGRNGVVNQSPLIPSSSQPEIYDIKEQEILVTKSTSGSMYHDGFTHVFSVVNGYDVGGMGDANAIRDKILSEIRFVGIATTEQKADDKLIDQGCVATVGGVTTVLNNGTEAIFPSQKVMLDINLSPARASITREKGIPRNKVRFSFRPADDDNSIIGRALGLCSIKNLNKKSDLKAYAADVKAKKLVRDAENAKYQKAKTTTKDTTGAIEVKDFPSNTTRTADFDLTSATQAERDALLAEYKKERDDAQKLLDDARLNLQSCQATTSPGGTTTAGRVPLATMTGNLPADKIKEFLQNYRHLNQLIIGKAMSYAAPGDRFELLLQPRHSL
tara:strand:- start:452 stop:1525 length:1074 start_codon:yes stop_codon:yes gene_type:complete